MKSSYKEQETHVWMSKLDMTDDHEINTLEIQWFFPEAFAVIESEQDPVKQIGVKQMVKLELQHKIKNKQEFLGQAKYSGRNNLQIHIPSFKSNIVDKSK